MLDPTLAVGTPGTDVIAALWNHDGDNPLRYLRSLRAWRILYETKRQERIDAEIADFQASEVHPRDKEAISARVEASITHIVGLETWLTVVEKLQDVVTYLAFRLPILLFVLAVGYVFFDLDRGDAARTFGVAGAVVVLMLGVCWLLAQLLQTTRPTPLSVLYLALAGISALIIWFSTRDFALFGWNVHDSTWQRYSLLTGFGGAGILTLMLAIAIGIRSLARAAIWSWKVHHYAEEEIVESLAFALARAETLARRPKYDETRARLASTLEWLSIVTRSYLPCALACEEPENYQAIEIAAAGIASDMRELTREVLLPRDAGLQKVRDGLASRLVSAAKSEWGRMVPEKADKESAVTPPKKSHRLPFNAIAAALPLVVVIVLPRVTTLDHDTAALVNTAFLPALGLFLAYVVNWLDPKSGEALTRGKTITDQFLISSRGK